MDKNNEKEEINLSRKIRSNNISLNDLLDKETKTSDDISKIKEISKSIVSSESIIKRNITEVSSSNLANLLDDTKLLLNNNSIIIKSNNIKNITSKNNILDINDEYTISFYITFNKFPSKLNKSKSNKYDNNIVEKKYSSRRSDIISFNYDNSNNKIEFGAMAPFGITSNNFQDISLYENSLV